MQIDIKRQPPISNAVFGELSLDGQYYCDTLERLEVILEAGTYEIIITFSPRFQRPLPLLLKVPNRTDIRIHSGNWPLDSEGCILVGMDTAPDSHMILQSRLALDPLVAKIQAALDASESVTLSVF